MLRYIPDYLLQVIVCPCKDRRKKAIVVCLMLLGVSTFIFKYFESSMVPRLTSSTRSLASLVHPVTTCSLRASVVEGIFLVFISLIYLENCG